MDNSKYNKGAKYFSNVEKVIKSIKQVSSNHDLKSTEYNDKVLMNMMNGLCAIVDTQSDILKYILSHDSNLKLDNESDEFAPGQFVNVKKQQTLGVIKELTDNDKVLVYMISTSTNIELDKKEIE